MTHRGGARHWAEKMGIPYIERAPGFAPIWTDERIRSDLRRFLRGRRAWRSRIEFERAGLKTLRDAVARTGGPPRWAAEFELPRREERGGLRRVWTEERLEEELRKFTAGRSEWPSRREFIEAGNWNLLTATYSWGGAGRWARHLGLKRSRRSRPPNRIKWRREPIHAGLAAFCAWRKRWPKYTEFVARGEKNLYDAASRTGGVASWAERIGVEL